MGGHPSLASASLLSFLLTYLLSESGIGAAESCLSPSSPLSIISLFSEPRAFAQRAPPRPFPRPLHFLGCSLVGLHVRCWPRPARPGVGLGPRPASSLACLWSGVGLAHEPRGEQMPETRPSCDHRGECPVEVPESDRGECSADLGSRVPRGECPGHSVCRCIRGKRAGERPFTTLRVPIAVCYPVGCGVLEDLLKLD